MYFVKTPRIIKPLGREFLWNFDRKKKEIYLTFDDGPTPGVTEVVLGLLSRYNARATFFCLGKNVEAHRELFERIISEGHTIGNHSQTHPDGWKTCTFKYVKDVLKGNQEIRSGLFRPPYGHISFSQSSLLKKKFRIVMWDVISGDFDPSIDKERCLRNVLDAARNGSIVVFHDSEKAKEKVLGVLEDVLKHFSSNGFSFLSIPFTDASSH